MKVVASFKTLENSQSHKESPRLSEETKEVNQVTEILSLTNENSKTISPRTETKLLAGLI